MLNNHPFVRSRPVRTAALGLLTVLLAAATPLPSTGAQAQSLAAAPARQEIAEFYASRGGRLLWFGSRDSAPEILIDLLQSAQLDGLDRRKYVNRSLSRAVRSGRGGDPAAARQADMLLSQAFVAYVRDLRRPGSTGVIYVDQELQPAPPSTAAILAEAAAAPSLERYVAQMGWMHPLYGRLRLGLMTRAYRAGAEYESLRRSLERARELPSAATRHVLVNIPAQRLYMYQDGQVIDSMRVVVGKTKNPTPSMAAYIRYTALNPYWNVAPDLAAERTAPNVLKQGLPYLRQKGYQVLSDWSDHAKLIDPRTIDWKAVAAGTTQVRLRQLPGPANSMGRMKFMFPNRQGIYLHDTPEKELLHEASRMFSGGCVRLERASALATWLYGRRLESRGARPEQKVPLPSPVPVYLTYLTALPSGRQFAYYQDIYGRDSVQPAPGRRIASSR